jgi:probable F420-dependent oxidoreductase
VPAPTSSPASTPGLLVNLPTFAATDPGGWNHLFDVARAADEAGVDGLTVSDHVVFGENLDAYGRPELGGAEGGRQPTGPDGLWLEPLTVLTAVAAVTTRVRLATNILLAALRRPVVLAKTTATLDVLSGGRLDLGVGVGWQREEYEAAGLDFGQRGRLLDHTLAVCEVLWRDSPARFDGDGLQFERIHSMPKPVQPGGLPVWVSGTINQRVLQRIVRFGSGWIPWGNDSNDPLPGIPKIYDALSAAGRDPSGFLIRGRLGVVRGSDGKPDLGRTMDAVPALVAAGVTHFAAGVTIPADRNAAADFLAEVVTAFRQVTDRPS